MAEVQLALQHGPAGFEKLVVVKLVHQNLASQKDFVDMLLDEARVAALLKHPNVVDIYDLGEADGRFFIALEYLEGEPLLAVLRAGREGKRLDMLSTARLIADTAEGLDAAHELRSMGGDPLELVHHDVSLGNIVVLYNGQVKLVDFGVAKATQSVSQNRRVQGKFSYMAPEKLRGSAGDRRSDIWSLGCVLWEALTLKRLFKGGNDKDTMRQVLESDIPLPSRVNDQVPAELDPIVMRSLQRDPAERYATAKTMAGDLEEVLRTQGYGGKNDKIAKYMQATFAAHIDARKRLLQEVSSKGRASADVLEAAFDDPAMLASGSPSHGEFSVRFKPNTLEIRGPNDPAKPRPNDSSSRIRLDDLARRRPESTPGQRVIDPFGQVRPPSSQPIEYPRAQQADLPGVVTPALDEHGPTQVTPPILGESMPAAPHRASRRRAILAIAGVAAAAVLVVVLIASRGDEPASAGNPELLGASASGGGPGGSAGGGSATEPAAATDAAVAPDASSEEIIIVDPPVMKPPEPDPPKTPKTPKAEKTDPAALYRSGINAYVLGDMKTAMAYFRRALAANPGFAIAWRGAGLVHERLGETRAATTAFQRYLQLAPDAKDAATIRGKLKGSR